MKHFVDIAFTDAVKAEQERLGSRNAYAQMTAQPAPDGLGPAESAFIEARDSFYMASVTETGWPYVQHRGGPTGFLKVIASDAIAFADYRGNRQFVSAGNFKTDGRVALILMDYPNKRRLKLLGEATVRDAADALDLADRVAIEGAGRVERLVSIKIAAFDWNCPQFITPRFTEAEVQAAARPLGARIAALEAENEALKARLAGLSST